MLIKAKKIWKWLGKILFVLVFGSGGAILANYYLLPHLGLKVFKENVTIINKTEEVAIKEDNQINRVASQAVNAVVSVISSQANNSKVGTGIILTNDGLIVSFRGSVLEKGATYKVVLMGGQTHEAVLEGVDEFTNLVYFKIDASNLTSVSFANSDDYYAGKKLILVAPSEGEMEGRFSGATLSGLNRTFNIAGEALSNSGKLEGVFDIDGSNLKEFLGCAVADYNGELGGILGSVRVDNQDRFFIIPVNEVKKSFELAVKKELANRPNLGIYYISLNKINTAIYRTNRGSGALIYSPSGKQGLAVIANSPADRADLKIGDVIIAVNSEEVNLKNSLSNLIANHKKGEEITLTIIRGEKEQKIKVEL